MKIIVLRNYGGSLTGEKRILPGEYDSEDKGLFGLAGYLIENGHATVIGQEDTKEDDVVYTKIGEGRDLIMSEGQMQAIYDITSEAIAAQEQAEVKITVEDVPPMEVGVDMATGRDVTITTEAKPPKKSGKKK